MMRGVLALILTLLLAACATTPAKQPDPLKVMTFNVRLPVKNDGVNFWDNRRATAIAMLARTQPDIIGTQELWQVQGDDIVRALPQYRWFGMDRRGGHSDEHMGIFYRTDRLRLIQSGDFALSDTPDVPGSISWGHLYPRMVTWGVFERLSDGRRFALYNTHLPYRAEDDAAREKGAALLSSRLSALPADMPVILTGDFNTSPESQVYGKLSNGLDDTWLTASQHSGPAETFHNFTGQPDRRIDWIMARGFSVKSVTTVTDHDGPVYASDHYPVMASLNFR